MTNKRYCLVVDGTITKYNLTQKQTGLGVNTSIDVYLAKGFYPLEDNAPTIDSTTQRISGKTFEVLSDKVVCTYDVVDIPVEDLKPNKIQQIKSACTANEPVTLDVDFIDGTIKTITFNGGDDSASAIASAVELAQNLNEANVSLWDYDNIIHHNISFAEAMTISAFIAKKYRDDMFKRQDLLKQINDATTIEELGAIQWI